MKTKFQPSYHHALPDKGKEERSGRILFTWKVPGSQRCLKTPAIKKNIRILQITLIKLQLILQTFAGHFNY